MDHRGGIYEVLGGGGGLVDALRGDYSCAVREFVGRRRLFLDTFDWRLYERGHTLTFDRDSDGSSLALGALSGEVGRRLALATPPAFPADLPICPLRDQLERVCDVRRLLPTVELHSSGIEVSLLDGRRKTVARVLVEEATGSSPHPGGTSGKLPTRAAIVPVKGYPEVFRRVRGLLDALPWVTPLEKTELDLALAAVGRFPGDYSSKLNLTLRPEMPARDAVRSILKTLFDVLCANQDGVIRNLDPEFLHDFRVAIRRSRSLLAQAREAVPEVTARSLRGELRWLGRETGRLRDLDVYLIRLRDTGAVLPPVIRDDLGPLVQYLAARHSEEHARLVDLMSSPRYRRLLDELNAFVNGVDRDGSASNRPVVEQASERIWKAYRRIVRLGRNVSGDAGPSAFHWIRLECKKLRYLLEFFQSLYEPEFVRRQVRVLKGLQDVLGEYNDLHVQRSRLREFAREMASRGPVPAETLLAMGQLSERMGAEQARERGRYRRRFRAFGDRMNRDQLRSRLRPHLGVEATK